MSNFFRITKHPTRGSWHTATWLDSYYGPRLYGVMFKPEDSPTGHGEIYDTRKWEFETRDEGPGEV